MDSIQIENILQRYNIANFSITPLNHISEIDGRRHFYIINTASCFSNGEHWFVVYMMDKCVEIFDPLAVKSRIVYPNLYRLLKTLRKNIVENNKPLQDFFGDTCGLHVLFYILLRKEGIPLKMIIKNVYPYLRNKLAYKYG